MTKLLKLSKDGCDGNFKSPRAQRNLCIILGCLAEKMAGKFRFLFLFLIWFALISNCVSVSYAHKNVAIDMTFNVRGFLFGFVIVVFVHINLDSKRQFLQGKLPKRTIQK